jgi:uncharacterized protein YbjT (DUF2867 family)
MNNDTGRDLVTGAFSHSGSGIAARLLELGRTVRTLTFHGDRSRGPVEAVPYRFDDPVALVRSFEGVTTFYNTYWVRFEYGRTTFADAVANSKMLFYAAHRAGVSRIIHVSVSNPTIDSPLPYFHGKALVERALAEVGLPYSIVRPTWIYGSDRELLANNIGWVLRHYPIFPIPGDGRYQVQPVHIDDFARICEQAAHIDGDAVLDAAGPERLSYEELVAAISAAVGSEPRIIHVPPALMAATSRALGVVVRDVPVTTDEIKGLIAELLISDQAPLGQIAFSDWVSQHGSTLGLNYVNELRNHFADAGPRRGLRRRRG